MSLRDIAATGEEQVGNCRVCWLLDTLPNEDAEWLQERLNGSWSGTWIAKKIREDADTPSVGETTVRKHRRDCMS